MSDELNIQIRNLNYSYAGQAVFRGLDANFQGGNLYVITGDNGVGKSTLLKLLAGLLEAEPGEIDHCINGQKIRAEELYFYGSACASWLSLPGNLQVKEFLMKVQRFKPFIYNYGVQDLIQKANLTSVQSSLLKNLSDGQYQRVALFYALFVQSAFTVLDEPLRALDSASLELYRQALMEVRRSKTLFISSHRTEFYADIPAVKYFALCPFV